GDTTANYRVRVNAGAGAENISPAPETFSGVTTNVLVAAHAPGITGTELRIDGQVTASGSADKNSDNFAAQPFFIGSRSAASRYFKGRVYALAINDTYTTTSV